MDQSVVVTQVTISAIIVALVNWAKSSSFFPAFIRGRTWLIRGVSLALSFVGGLGVHSVWTASADGGHVLTFAIPSLAVLGLNIWAGIKQFTLTEVIHHSTKPTSNPQLVAAIAPKVARVEELIPEKEPIIGKGK